MARNSNEQSLGQVINDMLKAYRLEGRMRELDVAAAWEQAMGSVVAKKTREVKLRGKNLIVSLESGVMKEEFSLNKQRVIDLVNDQLGERIVEHLQIF
jgi:predicted nucleic acid-binding Zn ribbon protein